VGVEERLCRVLCVRVCVCLVGAYVWLRGGVYVSFNSSFSSNTHEHRRDRYARIRAHAPSGDDGRVTSLSVRPSPPIYYYSFGLNCLIER